MRIGRIINVRRLLSVLLSAVVFSHANAMNSAEADGAEFFSQFKNDIENKIKRENGDVHSGIVSNGLRLGAGYTSLPNVFDNSDKYGGGGIDLGYILDINITPKFFIETGVSVSYMGLSFGDEDIFNGYNSEYDPEIAQPYLDVFLKQNYKYNITDIRKNYNINAENLSLVYRATSISIPLHFAFAPFAPKANKFHIMLGAEYRRVVIGVVRLLYEEDGTKYTMHKFDSEGLGLYQNYIDPQITFGFDTKYICFDIYGKTIMPIGTSTYSLGWGMGVKLALKFASKSQL